MPDTITIVVPCCAATRPAARNAGTRLAEAIHAGRAGRVWASDGRDSFCRPRPSTRSRDELNGVPIRSDHAAGRRRVPWRSPAVACTLPAFPDRLRLLASLASAMRCWKQWQPSRAGGGLCCAHPSHQLLGRAAGGRAHLLPACTTAVCAGTVRWRSATPAAPGEQPDRARPGAAAGRPAARAGGRGGRGHRPRRWAMAQRFAPARPRPAADVRRPRRPEERAAAAEATRASTGRGAATRCGSSAPAATDGRAARAARLVLDLGDVSVRGAPPARLRHPPT